MGTCRTWWRDELLPSHRHLEKCLQWEKWAQGGLPRVPAVSHGQIQQPWV